MRLENFIDALYKAGWESSHDGQHDNIEALWRKLFPSTAELHDELIEADEHVKELQAAEDSGI